MSRWCDGPWAIRGDLAAFRDLNGNVGDMNGDIAMVRRALGDPGRFCRSCGLAAWQPYPGRAVPSQTSARPQPDRVSIHFTDPADVRLIAILLRWRAIPDFGTALKMRRGPLRRGAER